jgi:aspartate kinase
LRIVMKFGGTSVRGDGFRRIHEIVSRHLPENQVVVVVSAIKGVTDELIDAAHRARRGDEREISEFLDRLVDSYMELVEVSLGREHLNEAFGIASKLKRDLERVLFGIMYLGELTPRSLDYVAGYGETFSAKVGAFILSKLGLEAVGLTGKEAGIVTDDTFGDARILLNATRYSARRAIEPLLEAGKVPVVGGFTGATQEGVMTTLGRGGSDYTATALGAALDADQVWLWSDVDGIMTADPRIVPNARTVPELSYREAAELAVVGAKALHPRALEPVWDAGIPVYVRNTFNPNGPYTVIHGKEEVNEKVVKAVSLIREAGIITVYGPSMVGAPGTAAKVLEVVGSTGTNIMMIAQSASESNISIAVRRTSLDKVYSALERELVSRGVLRSVEVEDDVSIVAVVGAGMKGTPGVSAKIFSAVAERGINVIMVAQGGSEMNISFAVKAEDADEAVRAVHDAFRLGEA